MRAPAGRSGAPGVRSRRCVREVSRRCVREVSRRCVREVSSRRSRAHAPSGGRLRLAAGRRGRDATSSLPSRPGVHLGSGPSLASARLGEQCARCSHPDHTPPEMTGGALRNAASGARARLRLPPASSPGDDMPRPLASDAVRVTHAGAEDYLRFRPARRLRHGAQDRSGAGRRRSEARIDTLLGLGPDTPTASSSSTWANNGSMPPNSATAAACPHRKAPRVCGADLIVIRGAARSASPCRGDTCPALVDPRAETR
jgi:hypothetical protein